MRNQKLINQKIAKTLKAKYDNGLLAVPCWQTLMQNPEIQDKRKKAIKDYHNNKPIEKWGKYRLRKFLLDKVGWVCSECGYSRRENETGPFQVHHIDGDETNNESSNLKVLCYNCHWFTHNWGHRGKKHSEQSKRKISESKKRTAGVIQW